MLKAIIIDDERAGREYLSNLITEFIPSIKVIGIADSALSGMKLLVNNEIDIIFLDIEMPNGTGFDFVESIQKEKYKIVFTTAHKKYAHEAFKVHADAYLIKPIDLDDLEEVTNHLENTNSAINISEKIAFKTQDSIEYIEPKNIIRVEGEGNYSTVFSLGRKKIVISKNLKQLEELLSHSFFIKTHKSHIINKNHIERFVKTEGGHFEMIDKSIVPLSRRKKELILSLLDSEL